MTKSSCLSSIAVAALMTFGAACAKKPVAAAPPPPPPAPQATQQTASNTRTATQTTPAPAPALAAATSRYPDAATRARIDELLARIQDAYFDYNKHTLRPDAVSTLNSDAKELATIMTGYPDYKLRVEGYCDERGSSEYNLALGEARAKAAKDFLVSAGVKDDQLSTVSFGKERQTCEDHDEACWSQNRRVHIMALKQ